ncbi:MAG: hypothetical protein AB9873_13120 [Syntrophobacteraceae bacterium]
MKSFRFESVWLLSHQERRARTVDFHRNRNLILGRNHTGKSSLIRSLFETLGASPQGRLEKWDDNTVSVVDFSIDGLQYRALHQKGCRALFDQHETILAATTSHSVWSQHFAKITGFNLVLTDKDSETVPADPTCFFLPFYINQDGSWQAGWQTFRGLQRYRSPQKATLEYFAASATEYYEFLAQRDLEQKALNELRKDMASLERARERFNKSISLSGPKIQPENFEREIARLTKEVTELNKDQEKLRDVAVREQELLGSIQLQVSMATEALSVYDSDMSYLRKEGSDSLTCPVCGAEHSNSFYDLLIYAEDARTLRQLVLGLHEDERKARIKFHSTQKKILELETNYNCISKILNTRRGDLRFEEVVESMGAEGTFKAFEKEGEELERQILIKLNKMESLSKQLDELTNKERATEILNRFRGYYASARDALSLLPKELKRLKINSRPETSGSGGPRAILAYYAALWRICHDTQAPFSIPAVIDSPNQQSQDDINLPKVLKFIAEKLPQVCRLSLAWK